MTEPSPVEDERVRTVTESLMSAFAEMGIEHQALVAEANRTTAKERQGTVRRMADSIEKAACDLIEVVDTLAVVYGMRALGINGQRAKSEDGRAYTPLPTIGDPDVQLYDAAFALQAVVEALGAAYQPTRKYPGLAVARRPQQMKVAIASVRAGLSGLCAELDARNQAEDAAEFGQWVGYLEELEHRTCRETPAQTAGLTADQVASAIRADPAIARAAAAALQRVSG